MRKYLKIFIISNTKQLSRILIVFWILFLGFYSTSISQRSFFHLSVENGLASTVVHDLLIDHKGYLWIATEAGLNRYDGKNLKLYTSNDGLGGNEILKILMDSQDRIWFLSFNGIVSFYQGGKFYNPDNTPFLRHVSNSATLNNIYEDSKGRIWIINESGNIFTITGENVSMIDIGTMNLGNVRQVWEYDGWMYFGALSGLFRWKDTVDSWEQIDETVYWSIRSFVSKSGERLIPNQKGITTPKLAPNLLFSNQELGVNTSIHSVLITTKLNVLVIGTIQGGIKFYRDYLQNDLTPTNNWLENETISSTIMDNEGSIWISTLDNGIYRVDRGFSEFQYLNEQNGLNDSAIRSSLITSDNQIWYGGKDGSLYRVNEAGEITFKTQIKQSNALNSSIETLSEPNTGKLVIGTIGGVFELDINNIEDSSDFKNSTTMFLNGELKSLLESSFSVKAIIGNNDTLYVGTNRKLLRYTGQQYEKLDKLLEKRITALEYDRNGDLFIGMLDGLYKKIQDDIHKIDSTIIKNTQILDIKRLYGPWLGISTYGSGLILKCTQTGTIRQITTEHGLTSNLVKSTFFDESGNLWVGTNQGINKISLDTTKSLSKQLTNLPIISYTWSDGLNIDQINRIDVTKNKVWISGNNGITLFSKDFLGYENQKIPLIVEEVKVNGVTYDVKDSYEVNYRENQWEINFSGIYLRDGSKIKYRYMIPELSQDWVITTTGNINLRYLNHGEYTLNIEAFTLDNRAYSDPIQMSITILPPFWKTSWFIFMTILVIIVLLAQLIRWSVKTEIEAQKINHDNSVRVIELEHQALMAMMKPHTIYNQISALQFLLFSGNTEKARDMIMKFTKILRLQLDSTFKKSNSLEDEINRIKLQLELDSEKFEKEINFKFECDASINPKKCLLPSLILQPFIENSINHGLLNKKEFGEIRIEAYLNQIGQLVIAIEDNGIGFKEKESYFVNSKTPIDEIPLHLPSKKLKQFEVQQSPSIGLHLFIERIRLISYERKLNWEIHFRNIRDGHNDIIGALVLVTLPIMPELAIYFESKE